MTEFDSSWTGVIKAETVHSNYSSFNPHLYIHSLLESWSDDS